MLTRPHPRKMILTGLLVIVLLLILVPATRVALFEGHLFKTVDATAVRYVDEGLVRAGTAFAIARTFNAIVSVFQESKLQLEPGGVGVSLALGAALDPANDLVERFSWVMLASLTSLGVQKVLIEMTPFLSMQILLLLALLTLLAGLWWPNRRGEDLTRIGRILLVTAILVRCAVPMMAYLNNLTYVTFLEERYDQSVESLSKTVTALEQQQLESPRLTPPADSVNSEPEDGWWDRIKASVGETVDQGTKMLDLGERLETIKQATLDLIDRIVDLIVVFVLSTILLPLLFLWGLLKLGRLIIGRGLANLHFGP